MTPTLENLIRECESEIRNCENLVSKYEGNDELYNIYTAKILHYNFMICRLRRHLEKEVTPKPWCENELN